MASLLGLGLAASAAGRESSAPHAGPGPGIRLVRFYRADRGQTSVKAFVNVPLTNLAASPDGKVVFRITAQVRDSAGTPLADASWMRRAPQPPPGSDAFTVELMEFTVQPGRYDLAVTIEDSVGGTSEQGHAQLDAFSGDPGSSDLLLAPSIRAAGPGDTMPLPGQWRYANTVITTATDLVLTPNRTSAFYLLEAYSSKEDSGKMVVAVVDSAGHELMTTPPRRVKLYEGGGVLSGKVDLTGTPPGRYNFVLRLDLGDRHLERSAPVVVQEGEHAAPEPPDPDVEFFAAMTPQQLDEAEAPLSYIAESGELTVWKNSLSQAAKAKFLAEFWHKRNPNAGGATNPVRIAFYAKIDEANQLYGEREGRAEGRARGWRTDRGRIYLKYGKPDDRWTQPREGPTPPLEVWQYTRERNRYFIFADRLYVGTYKLLYTNELKEQSLPGWQDILGYGGMDKVSHYLGVNLFGVETSRFQH
jgi:GWxTD domain-containing protein